MVDHEGKTIFVRKNFCLFLNLQPVTFLLSGGYGSDFIGVKADICKIYLARKKFVTHKISVLTK